MRYLIAIVASALGGVAALIIFNSVFGLQELYFRDPILVLLYSSLCGSTTGIFLVMLGFRAADLVAGIIASLSLALFHSISITINVVENGAIRSSADLPEFMLMTLVYFASFGTLPGLAWYLAMVCFSEKR